MNHARKPAHHANPADPAHHAARRSIGWWATAAQVALFLALDRATERLRQDGDRGQTTAEYALVLLGVAAIALAVVSWASRTNLVSRLLDVVFSALFRKIT